MASRVQPIDASMEDVVGEVESKADAVLFDSDLGLASLLVLGGVMIPSQKLRALCEHLASLGALLFVATALSGEVQSRLSMSGAAKGHDRNGWRENAGGGSVSGGGSGASCWDRF